MREGLDLNIFESSIYPLISGPVVSRIAGLFEVVERSDIHTNIGAVEAFANRFKEGSYAVIAANHLITLILFGYLMGERVASELPPAYQGIYNRRMAEEISLA